MEHVKIALLILLISIGHTGYGQYFSNLYREGRPSMLFGSIQQLNGKLYVIGVTSTVRSPYYSKAVFGKLNVNGNVDFVNSIVDSDNYQYAFFTNSLKKTTDGNFIASEYKIDSIQKALLMKCDTNGNILLWRSYSEPYTMFFDAEDVVEISDSGYMLAVTKQDSDYISSVVIIRTNKSGDILNETNYLHGSTAYPWVIRPMYNGHYMIGAWVGPSNGNTPYHAHTWLIEVDSMGNEVRNWQDPELTNLWPNGMEQTADSGWIIVRQHMNYDINGFQAYNASILKLDKDFNKQWEIDTGGIAQDAGMYDVKILEDGSYICAGANPIDNFVDSTSNIYGWLMKVSQAGQIIWQKFYLPDSSYEAYNYLNSVALMPDGGFVACGQTQSSAYGQQGWIIRTDSMGCLLDNCGREYTAINNIGTARLNIKCYPNPTGNYLTVETPDITQTTLLQVTDNLGRLVLQQNITATTTQLQFNNQPAGVYFIRVSDGNGLLAVNRVVVMH